PGHPTVGGALRRDGRPRLAAARDPDRGRCRRPAGGALRPGLLRAGDGQEHVRDRLLSAHEHRPDRDPLERRAAGDGRLADRRRHGICSRGQRVHRGRRDPVAPRRTGRARERRREPAARGVRPRYRGRVPGAGVRRPRGALLGHARARRGLWADARDDPRPPRAGGPRGDRVSEPRRARDDAGRRGRSAQGAPGRRRRGRQRLSVPVPSRRHAGGRAPAVGDRHDGARRRVPRGARRGDLGVARGGGAPVGDRAEVCPGHGRVAAGCALRGLAACRRTDAWLGGALSLPILRRRAVRPRWPLGLGLAAVLAATGVAAQRSERYPQQFGPFGLGPAPGQRVTVTGVYQRLLDAREFWRAPTLEYWSIQSESRAILARGRESTKTQPPGEFVEARGLSAYLLEGQGRPMLLLVFGIVPSPPGSGVTYRIFGFDQDGAFREALTLEPRGDGVMNPIDSRNG